MSSHPARLLQDLIEGVVSDLTASDRLSQEDISTAGLAVGIEALKKQLIITDLGHDTSVGDGSLTHPDLHREPSMPGKSRRKNCQRRGKGCCAI